MDAELSFAYALELEAAAPRASAARMSKENFIVTVILTLLFLGWATARRVLLIDMQLVVVEFMSSFWSSLIEE